MTLGRSGDEDVAQYGTGDDAGEGGEQGSGQGVAGFGYFCGHEIDGHGVKDGFCTAHADGSDGADEGIRSVF